MEQSSLQGVDPVLAREARQQGVITGEHDLRLAKKRNRLYRGNIIRAKETTGRF